MNEQQLLDIATTEHFVEQTDDNDRLWFGTQYWCAMQRGRKSRIAKFTDLVAEAETDVELTRVIAHGSPMFIRITGGLCRVYERPDGEQVIVNDAYAMAVELLIGSTVEVKLMQGHPLRPIAFVTAEGETVGLIMPIRVS